jgi:hypothetical protein
MVTANGRNVKSRPSNCSCESSVVPRMLQCPSAFSVCVFDKYNGTHLRTVRFTCQCAGGYVWFRFFPAFSWRDVRILSKASFFSSRGRRCFWSVDFLLRIVTVENRCRYLKICGVNKIKDQVHRTPHEDIGQLIYEESNRNFRITPNKMLT